MTARTTFRPMSGRVVSSPHPTMPTESFTDKYRPGLRWESMCPLGGFFFPHERKAAPTDQHRGVSRFEFRPFSERVESRESTTKLPVVAGLRK